MARPRKEPGARSRMIPRALTYLRNRGLDTEALAAELGLPPHAERLEEVSLSPADFERLIGRAAAELDDPLLALRLPQSLEWSSYQLAELAARAAPNLRESFARVVRYASLFYGPLVFAIEDREDQLVVRHRIRGRGRGRFGNEFALASVLINARRLSATRLAPRSVWFAHPAPREAEQVRDFFETESIAFDRADSGLAFAASVSELPSIGADPKLLVTAEQLADRALGAQPLAPDFVAQVAARLRDSLSAGQTRATVVARKMRLSLRTLQRRLEEEGTSWSELFERVRADLGRDLVRNSSLPLGEIGYRLGFSDPAAFHRAFKRWTGQAPGAFRRSGG